MGFSEMANFVLKHEQKNFKDTISISRADLKPFCVVDYEYSWKMPKIWNVVLINSRMRSTDVRLTGAEGALLGEIHEIPTGTLRLIRKWEVYEKGVFKGVVTEKPKFIGSNWVLEDVKGNPLASVEGDRKKHNYEVVTSDRDKQMIARCFSLENESYGLEILVSSVDSFLVLCYAIVLDLAKTHAVVERRDL